MAYKAIGQYIRPLLEAGCSRTIGVEVQTDETLQSQWGALPCAHVSDNIEMMHAIEQGKHRLILKVSPMVVKHDAHNIPACKLSSTLLCLLLVIWIPSP